MRREELPTEPAISGAERREELTTEAAKKQQLIPPSSNPEAVSTQERELETHASEKTKDDAELEEVREQVGEGGGSSTERSDSINEEKYPPSPNDLLAALTSALTTVSPCIVTLMYSRISMQFAVLMGRECIYETGYNIMIQ